jgi:hypothetical protein
MQDNYIPAPLVEFGTAHNRNPSFGTGPEYFASSRQEIDANPATRLYSP